MLIYDSGDPKTISLGEVKSTYVVSNDDEECKFANYNPIRERHLGHMFCHLPDMFYPQIIKHGSGNPL